MEATSDILEMTRNDQWPEMGSNAEIKENHQTVVQINYGAGS